MQCRYVRSYCSYSFPRRRYKDSATFNLRAVKWQFTSMTLILLTKYYGSSGGTFVSYYLYFIDYNLQLITYYLLSAFLVICNTHRQFRSAHAQNTQTVQSCPSWISSKDFLLDKTMAYNCALNNCSNGSYWLKNWGKLFSEYGCLHIDN